ncbi:hypothetical protein GCM10020255_032180 [Rhodococcus baikonurensis]
MRPRGIATSPAAWINQVGRPIRFPGSTARTANYRNCRRTSAVEYITGALSPNQTVERFNVLGTDLGIMWDNGAGQVLTAFGDTVGIGSDPCAPGWSVTGAATSCSVARTETCPTA